MPVLRPVRRLITSRFTIPAPATPIAFDNAVNGGFQGNNAARTYSFTIGGGDNRLLVVGWSGEYSTAGTGSSVTGITYDGVALTQAVMAREEAEAAKLRVELWYLLESGLPAAGAHDIVVSVTGGEVNANGYGTAALSLENVAQGAPEAVEDNNTAVDGTTFSSNIVTSTPGAWVVDMIAAGVASSFTADAGQDERTDQSGAPSGQTEAMSTEHVASPGTATLGWTLAATSNRFAHALAAWGPG